MPADLDDAVRAAQTYIHATQPGDRIVDEGHGVYAIWTGPAPSTRLATLVIAPTDDHSLGRGRRTARNPMNTAPANIASLPAN